MELTAENVRELFIGCMYKEEIKSEEEIPHGSIVVEGIRNTVVFDPKMVKSNKEDIKDLLGQISEDFSSKEAGGTSFMNLPMTKDGIQWGEHMNAEQLMLLGIASGYMTYLVPPDGWKMLPGGMPYLVVSFEEKPEADVSETDMEEGYGAVPIDEHEL